MPIIHPTAIVHPETIIAETVSIGPFTVIEKDVSIDDGTTVGAHCYFESGAQIGKNNKISHGVVFAAPPQDVGYANEKTGLVVGDNNIIREYATLHRATSITEKTRVGSNCFLMAYSHVAHDCIVGDNVILVNSVQLGGHSIVEDYVIIGGGSQIHQFCRVGAHVMMSGGTGTNKDVPPYVKAGPHPARFAGINAVGLRRRGFSVQTIDAISNCYKTIYNSGMNTSQAVEYVKATFDLIPEVQQIIDFIQASTRGIIPRQH
jgi:UDP-N-acetylglucosamine acyltransferase